FRSCNGAATGVINISAPTGGTARYTYNIDGGTYQAIPSFTGLVAGTYAVNIQDANNCIVSLGTQTITENNILAATLSGTEVLCNGAATGVISINTPTGGTAPYTYNIDGGTYQAIPSFTGLAAGTYAVNIQD